MEYLLNTSGAKRQEEEEYALGLLCQLTNGISTTFQQDRKLLKTVLAQINALAERRNALVTNQIENKRHAQPVEQTIQQTPTSWLLHDQTQLQIFPKRPHQHFDAEALCSETYSAAGVWLAKMTNHIVQHHQNEEGVRFLTFINQELCNRQQSMCSYLNNTTGTNNFSEKDVGNYLNNVTAKRCSAGNNQIRMLSDLGANFFAFYSKDKRMRLLPHHKPL